jgi:uncharacterized protein with GYD domain
VSAPVRFALGLRPRAFYAPGTATLLDAATTTLLSPPVLRMMAKYVSLIKLRGSVQNVQKMASVWGDLDTEVREYGAELEQSYAILGEYDFMVVMEAPDRDTAFRASLAIENQGFDSQTMEIIPVEDFADLVED